MTANNFEIKMSGNNWQSIYKQKNKQVSKWLENMVIASAYMLFVYLFFFSSLVIKKEWERYV